MQPTYWHKQTTDKPLFPDMQWSQPENRLHAGKLLILGGNGYEFKAPANAYGDALDAGVGVAKVLLPDSMKKMMADIFPEAEFAPSTHSGSFARLALASALELAQWADAVLLAGNFGRNSETAIFLDEFLQKYDGLVVATGDALDYFLHEPTKLLQRHNTAILPTFSQLQKLAMAADFPTALTSDMDMLRFVDALHELGEAYPCHIIVHHLDHVFVATGGDISSTAFDTNMSHPMGKIAAAAAVWWLQHSGQAFQAITTAVIS